MFVPQGLSEKLKCSIEPVAYMLCPSVLIFIPLANEKKKKKQIQVPDKLKLKEVETGK